MSLVGSYVMMEDGNYYDLTIYGKDFFICWDDDDPPEIVIQAPEHQTKQQYKEIADSVITDLNQRGLKISIMGHNLECGRRFSGKFHHATAWWVKINAKIPMSFLPRGITPIIDEGRDGVYYTPGFSTEELHERTRKYQTWRHGITDYLLKSFVVDRRLIYGFINSAIHKGLIKKSDHIMFCAQAIANSNNLQRGL